MSLEVIFFAIVAVAIVMVLTIVFTNKKNSASGDESVQTLKDQLTRALAQIDSKNEEMERLRNDIKELNDVNDALQCEKGGLATKVGAKETEMAQRVEDMEGWYNRMKLEFEETAKRILEEKQNGLDEKNTAVIQPLKEALDKMKESVQTVKESCQTDIAAQMAKLKEMNDQLCSETNHLANVFKGGNLVQGKWGESQLERVLEISGLSQGESGYMLQTSSDNEKGGKDRPDCIINLPGNKQIIIDAKTNLVAYENSFKAVDEKTRIECLKEHAKALKEQIKNLADKHYHTNKEYNCPGFVIMFVPVEAALTAAQQYMSENLFQYASKCNITIATPWNLIPILLVIKDLWKTEQQNENVQKIANRATLLYDQIYQVLATAGSVKKNIEDAQNECDKLCRQLSGHNGSLIQQAKTLEKLGVKPKSTKKGESRVENTAVYKNYYVGAGESDETEERDAADASVAPEEDDC